MKERKSPEEFVLKAVWVRAVECGIAHTKPTAVELRTMSKAVWAVATVMAVPTMLAQHTQV
jgi:hypothetical protein